MIVGYRPLFERSRTFNNREKKSDADYRRFSLTKILNQRVPALISALQNGSPSY
jgi:hypothetical protein